jgi:hypothetical protein
MCSATTVAASDDPDANTRKLTVARIFIIVERQEHAPPLAGASVETRMEVHVTGDVDD